MMPACSHTGTPRHFHPSTTSGQASLISARTRASVSPRQSPTARTPLRRVAISNPQKARCVATNDLFAIFRTKRHIPRPPHAKVVQDKWPIHREKNSVHAQFHEAAHQRRVGEVAARGHVE